MFCFCLRIMRRFYKHYLDFLLPTSSFLSPKYSKRLVALKGAKRALFCVEIENNL